MVYSVCRHYPGLLWPSKGYASRSMPLSISGIEVTPQGVAAKRYGIKLVRLDSDFFKSRVHERFSRPDDQPGAFHLPEDVPDGVLKQLVSEARVVNDSGKVEWVQRTRDNHFLDAAALAEAAGYNVGVQRISDNAPDRRPETAPVPQSTPAKAYHPDQQTAAVVNNNPYYTDGKTVRATPVLDEDGNKAVLTNDDRRPKLSDIGNHAPTWDDLHNGAGRI